MLKHVLFTHDDLDGAGCRVIFELGMAHLKKGEDFDVVNCSNNNIDDKVTDAIVKDGYINNETVVYFADICPSIDIANVLMKKFQHIIICDHHRTNFPITNVIPDALIIPEDGFGRQESGTSILYRWFCDQAARRSTEWWVKPFVDSDATGRFLSLFVDTVRSYDTYEWKDTDNILAKKLQMLFFLLGMDRFCNRYVDRILHNYIPTEELIIPGDMDFIDAKLEFEQKTIDGLTIGDVYETEVKGYKTAFLLTPVAANISEVAYQFLQKYPQFDLFASVTLSRGGEFSFRTQNPQIDVGEIITKPIGGGGHPRASGAPIPDYIKDLFTEALICHINGCTFRAETWWENEEKFEDVNGGN